MAYHPFRHLGLKFLSVAIAVALWFAVAGEQTIERTVGRVPLAYQNQSDNMELVDNPPAAVDVRVRGAASLVSHLVPGDLVVLVDLSGAKTGRRIYHLTRAQVRAPFGVEIVQVTPGTVALTFEPSLTKVVPVQPNVEGQPALGFAAGRATVEPPSVAVVGPESVLRQVKQAVTEPVSVTGATRRIEDSVNVAVSDASVRLRTPMMVRVTIPIEPVPVERLVENVPVRLRGTGRGLAAQAVPPVVSVSTRGTKDALDRLSGGDISAYVDLAGLGPGRYNLPVRVERSPNVDVLQTDPATVRVRIR